MFKTYAMGFAFSEDGRRVALIEKTKPAWQAGRLNGIGGHVEAGEEPIHAMVREFFEETGVATVPLDWQHMAVLQGAGYDLYIYKAHLDIGRCQTTTEEKVDIHGVEDVLVEYGDDHIIPNIRWLISFCLHHGKTDSPGPVVMTFADAC